MPMAMWLLPVPVPPTRTTLRLASRKSGRELLEPAGIHGCLVERQVGQLLGERQPGRAHLVVDGAGLLGGDLGLEQGADDLLDAVLALDPGRNDIVVGRLHAEQLQARHQLQDLQSAPQVISMALAAGALSSASYARAVGDRRLAQVQPLRPDASGDAFFASDVSFSKRRRRFAR